MLNKLKNKIMKKIFLTLALASFVGATSMSASTFGDDKKGDDKKKSCAKECKKDGKSCCKDKKTTETKETKATEEKK